ncbi:MAG: hypothetical protein J07HN4v3_01871 [Halonotius sp. J07HN4]|nr:MAG: hypothetical protein J07HN4v3_01871 [Halonotius sp. J07HN4]
MPFSATWHNLLEPLEALPADAVFRTPLSDRPFRVTDSQEHRILIQFRDDTGTTPLSREQFETLYERVTDAPEGFDLDRLPADAEPYATLLSVHPRFAIDTDANTLTEREEPTTPLVDAPIPSAADSGADDDRSEPDVPVYNDALLLIDALERTDPTDLSGVETATLVDLYTLCSDVQRNADELRQTIRGVLLDRLTHDQPIAGQYGSIQRTTRRNRSLKDDEAVITTLEAAGVDKQRLLSVDREKVDDALAVTEVTEEEVYEIDDREYVRKADVDDDTKASRLQGLKDRLAAAAGDDTDELRAEIEALEKRIDELTSFKPGQAFHGDSTAVDTE